MYTEDLKMYTYIILHFNLMFIKKKETYYIFYNVTRININKYCDVIRCRYL